MRRGVARRFGEAFDGEEPVDFVLGEGRIFGEGEAVRRIAIAEESGVPGTARDEGIARRVIAA